MYILITFLCAYLIFCNTQLFITCCGQWKIVIFVWTIKISVVLAETGAGAATCSRSEQILSLLSVHQLITPHQEDNTTQLCVFKHCQTESKQSYQERIGLVLNIIYLRTVKICVHDIFYICLYFIIC